MSLSFLLTFVLGTATALAFYLVGGMLALNGPYVLERSWPVIYTLEALFVATVMFVVARLLRSRLTLRRLGAIIVAAWIGQYVVLAVGLLAGELNPINALWFWILATGGPLQPVAAYAGGWLGPDSDLATVEQALTQIGISSGVDRGPRESDGTVVDRLIGRG